jgi:hypothetical protein
LNREGGIAGLLPKRREQANPRNLMGFLDPFKAIQKLQVAAKSSIPCH